MPTQIRPDRMRRLILKSAIAGLVSGFGIGWWLKVARAADAAQWPKDAFTQKSEADAIKALYGKEAEASDKVKLDAPEIAENGAVVPISVSSTLPDVTSIAIMVTENPFPLGGELQNPAWHVGHGLEQAQNGQDQQSRRLGRIRTARSTARPRKSKSPSAAAAADGNHRL